jgi:DNA-binding HxlR family transcriptional regulator
MAAKCKASAELLMDMDSCPVRTTIDVIDGKWKPLIVYQLKVGKQRFGRLRRSIPEAPRKVLTEQLREMEKDGLVQRKISRRPLEVEYSLTEYGETLVPILVMMAEWGERHKKIKHSAADDLVTA